MLTTLTVLKPRWALSRDGWYWHLLAVGGKPPTKRGKVRMACGQEMYVCRELAPGEPQSKLPKCQRCLKAAGEQKEASGG